MGKSGCEADKGKSLVELRVHGYLEVVVVEGAGLVQHRQHVLFQRREKDDRYSENREKRERGERYRGRDSQETCLAGCPEREDAALRYSVAGAAAVTAAGSATGAKLPLLHEEGTALPTESRLGF